MKGDTIYLKRLIEEETITLESLKDIINNKNDNFKFISRFFILFATIVNGIAFLVFLFTSSLLVYRNATDLVY